MELKLKRRELKITLYDGSKLNLKYPTKLEHDSYIKELLEEGSNDSEVTRKFFLDMGMPEETFNDMEQPDLYEIGMILTSQKKI